MNENLERVRELNDTPVVHFEYDGHRWYCDGMIIVREDSLPLMEYEPGSKPAKMAIGATKILANLDLSKYSPLRDGGMFGDLCGFGYIRRLHELTWNVTIKERYRRVFPDNCEFWGTAPDKQVAIYTGSELIGIIMPVRPKGFENAPEVR